MKSPIKTSLYDVDREMCRRSLATFAKQAWHVLEPSTELKWGWSTDAICEHLEAISYGDITRLLMNVPPGMTKSLLTGVIWPAWEWGPLGRPELRILGTAHKQELAIRDAMKCRRLIQSEWYQARWPIVMQTDNNAKLRFENDKTGFREAMAFTSLTGSRGDRIIIDDPLSVDDANSDAALKSAEITFNESVPTRINDDRSAIIVIMQRLHERDTSGIIIDRDLGYTHLCLPMRHEKGRDIKTTSIGFTDPRTVDGELLFPERFSEIHVSNLEKAMGSYSSAGQLQQRPAPRGGGMFKKEWFEIVDATPAGCEWVRGWDLAATEDNDSAWTAGVKIGRSKDGLFYIADCVRIQGSANAVEKLLKNTASQDGISVRGSIPQDPGQAGKAQVQYLIRQLAGYNYKSSTESGDKITRAAPMEAQAEAHNVLIVRGDWNNDFLDELTTFPTGKFKDQVDAATRAFNELVQPMQSAPVLTTSSCW